MSVLERLEEKIDNITEFIHSLPEWTPLSLSVAKEYNYKTIDGFRKWCERNIHPDDFEKRGRIYHIRTAVFQTLKYKKAS